MMPVTMKSTPRSITFLMPLMTAFPTEHRRGPNIHPDIGPPPGMGGFRDNMFG